MRIGEKPYGHWAFIPPPREMTEMPWWGHGIYILLPLLFIPAVPIPDPTAQISSDVDPTDENASREPIRRPESLIFEEACRDFHLLFLD